MIGLDDAIAVIEKQLRKGGGDTATLSASDASEIIGALKSPIDHRSLLREARVSYPISHQRPSWDGLFHGFSVLDDLPVCMIENRFGEFEAIPFMHVSFTDCDEEEV